MIEMICPVSCRRPLLAVNRCHVHKLWNMNSHPATTGVIGNVIDVTSIEHLAATENEEDQIDS